MGGSVLNTEPMLEFLPLCSTQLNIYVLDKVQCLQGGVCLRVGGRLESMARGFSEIIYFILFIFFDNGSSAGRAGRSATHHKGNGSNLQILRWRQEVSPHLTQEIKNNVENSSEMVDGTDKWVHSMKSNLFSREEHELQPGESKQNSTCTI